jgi:hypothetical protein
MHRIFSLIESDPLAPSRKFILCVSLETFNDGRIIVGEVTTLHQKLYYYYFEYHKFIKLVVCALSRLELCRIAQLEVPQCASTTTNYYPHGEPNSS